MLRIRAAEQVLEPGVPEMRILPGAGAQIKTQQLEPELISKFRTKAGVYSDLRGGTGCRFLPIDTNGFAKLTEN